MKTNIATRVIKKISRETKATYLSYRLRIPRFFVRRKRVESSLVVSLTSFPKRISKVWLVLESIYRQDLLPGKVILVLSIEEFPDKILPRNITKYFKLGLEVLFDEGNLKSYKKLLPVLRNYPNATIVTADDDVIYPRDWLETLFTEHRRRPGYVLGHRGTVIVTDGDQVSPYLDWPQATDTSDPDKVFLTGMGGILYPVGSLPDIIQDTQLINDLCPTGDDIWFKAMTMISRTPVAKVGRLSGDFPLISSSQVFSLNNVNVAQLQNDIQFHAVISHFSLWNRILK